MFRKFVHRLMKLYVTGALSPQGLFLHFARVEEFVIIPGVLVFSYIDSGGGTLFRGQKDCGKQPEVTPWSPLSQLQRVLQTGPKAQNMVLWLHSCDFANGRCYHCTTPTETPNLVPSCSSPRAPSHRTSFLPFLLGSDTPW